MNHPFMQAISERLAAVEIATLRYHFPYMEAHAGRPDRPAVCHATVRAAVAMARKKMPNTALIAGGKSFGGRMTSQTQASAPLPGVIGLAFFGFPWHPPNAPVLKRSEHLRAIQIPMLFMQATRDVFGGTKLVKVQVRKLHNNAVVLKTVPAADHGFQVPVKSGRTDSEVQDDLVRALSQWVINIR